LGEIGKNRWNIEPRPHLSSCTGDVCSMKLSVYFEESFIHFVFDMLTTDNSTGIRQKLKQSGPRYSMNLRRIIWVGSPENWRWKNIWLLRIRRRIRVDPCLGGGVLHVDRCIMNLNSPHQDD
jgi:hypothetical protein